MRKSFFARYSLIILLITAFLLPFVWGGTRRALEHPRNNIKEWLPQNAEVLNEHRWFQQNFPMEQFILISWEGCTIDDPRIPVLQKALIPKRDEKGVVIKEDWDMRYFISSQSGADYVNMLLSHYPEMNREEAIERLKGTLIGPNGKNTGVIVNLSLDAEGRDLRPQIKKIYKLCQESGIGAGADNIESVVHLGGPPVDNVAIDIEGTRTLMRLAWLSGLVGLTIAMLVFRSLRLTGIVLFTSVIAAGSSLAILYFTGGTVDAIMLSMPSLVYVLGMSGAVHIVNYYHDAIRDKEGLIGASDRAVGHAIFPCFYANLTTAIGLFSLLTSQVTPIRNFGFYTAIAVMATLLLLLFYLPALLYYFPSVKFANIHGQRGHSDDRSTPLVKFWRRFGKMIIAHHKLVLVICFGIMIAAAAGLPHLKMSVKLMKFFTPDTTIVKDYTWLEHHLGPLVPMEMVVRFDKQKCPLNTVQKLRFVKQLTEGIEHMDHTKVGGALSAASFTPDLAPRGVGAIRVSADQTMSERLDENRKDLREFISTDFQSAADRYPETSIEELGLSPLAFRKLQAESITNVKQLWNILPTIDSARFLTASEKAEVIRQARAWSEPLADDLWRITARVYALTDLDYGDFVPELKGQLDPILKRLCENKDGLTLAELRNSEVIQNNPQLTQNADGTEKGQRDYIPIDGVEIVYTGTVPLVYKTQHDLLDSLIESVLLSFLLIAALMTFVFRSVTGGFITMLPNLFPIVIVFGAMSWLGVLCDVGTMMTASVALGIAVDDTVHFLTWFRKGMTSGFGYKESIIQAYERCGAAITQTTLISGLGLSVFIFSTFTPTLRFGLMMLLILFTATLGDLILLPALLALSKGRFFRNLHFLDDFRAAPKSPDNDQYTDEIPEEELEDGSPEGTAKPGDTAKSAEGTVKPEDTAKSAEGTVKPEDTAKSAEGTVKPEDTAKSAEGTVKPEGTAKSAEGTAKPEDTAKSGDVKNDTPSGEGRRKKGKK